MRSYVHKNHQDWANHKLVTTEDKIWLPPSYTNNKPPPVSPVPKKRGINWGFAHNSVWEWTQFFAVLAIPIIVAAGSLYFTQQITLQQAQLSSATSYKLQQTDLNNAQDQQQETTLQTYLDDMSDLLLHQNLRNSKPGEAASEVARERTLTTLRRLNAERNRIVLQFLQDAHLIGIPDAPINLSGATLSNDYLSNANLSNTDLSTAHLSTAHLNGANLSGANLSGADLSTADLSGANLSGADLNGAHLPNAHLQCTADLSGATLTNADLSSAHLNGANLLGADLSGATLTNADLSSAHLTNAHLQCTADLSGANLSGATMTNATMTNAHLNGAILSGAHLNGAILNGADLSYADLSNATLSNAHLNGAILNGADLSNADLSNADLSYAHLNGAILIYADLSNADLSYAILNGARNLTPRQLKEVYSCLGATLPKRLACDRTPSS